MSTGRHPASPAAPGDLVSPVQRAIRLIEYVIGGGDMSSLSAIARNLDMNRITVGRLLDTLVHEDILKPVPNTPLYRCAPRLHRIAASIVAPDDLPRLAAPILQHCAQATGFSAYLSELRDENVVYICRAIPEMPLVSQIRVGSHVPARHVVPGRVLLAGRDMGHNGTRPAPLWNEDRFEPGVAACAIGVCTIEGRVRAAVSVAGPESLLSSERRHRIEQELQIAAEKMEQAMRLSR